MKQLNVLSPALSRVLQYIEQINFNSRGYTEKWNGLRERRRTSPSHSQKIIQAKENKDFATSDRIQKEFEAVGFKFKDAKIRNRMEPYKMKKIGIGYKK